MLDIYTHSSSPATLEFWKHSLRTLTRKYSGPQAVRDSLLRGLSDLNIPYTLNSRHPRYNVTLVLSGIEALREQIKRKQAGARIQLLAGPNLVITPQDAGGILMALEIDMVVVPSIWVQNAYEASAPSLRDKLFVWPAGVANAEASTRDGSVIIFNKDSNHHYLEEAVKAIHKLHVRTKIFNYGSFVQSDYLEALAKASAMVYLSPSESQGLALQEAWIRDVPTFVHFTGVTNTPAFTWHDEKINAPYLTDEFGAFYRTAAELTVLVENAATFHPRATCRKTLSDRASVELLLAAIKSE